MNPKNIQAIARKEYLHLIRDFRSLYLAFVIPLLFETGAETEMDAVACVTVSPEVQEKRVLERGTMTRDQFLAIRQKQMPNSEKCARSDFVIETDTLEHARAQVQTIVRQIREKLRDA